MKIKKLSLDLKKFGKKEQIGEGASGIVFRVVEQETNESFEAKRSKKKYLIQKKQALKLNGR